VLEKRIMKYSEGEIHFNLMAIVSDRKRLSYKKENVRRKHNNLPLIIELLTALAEEKKLVEGVKRIKEKKKASEQAKKQNK